MSHDGGASEATTDHEYDGIREHDNRLPRWWLVTLWGAIAFAFGYWGWFHTFRIGELPRDELRVQLAELESAAKARDAAAGAVGDPQLEALARDAAAVERGRAVYASTCMPCHGDKGQGVVGPNLTDDAWLHDERPSGIYATVADGVLTKGMPAWKPALGAEKVKEVVAFVLTLKNTRVPGKAPEGKPAGS